MPDAPSTGVTERYGAQVAPDRGHSVIAGGASLPANGWSEWCCSLCGRTYRHELPCCPYDGSELHRLLVSCPFIWLG